MLLGVLVISSYALLAVLFWLLQGSGALPLQIDTLMS